MALGSYETTLGWLGSENRKSSIRVFSGYRRLVSKRFGQSQKNHVPLRYLRSTDLPKRPQRKSERT